MRALMITRNGETKPLRKWAAESGVRSATVLCRMRRGVPEQHWFLAQIPREKQTKDKALYRCWAAMRARCFTGSHRAYPHYGGRGITVCQRWGSFDAFASDMGSRPSPAHSLDRINNDGNYEPGNCRWATSAEQSSNKRLTVRLTIGGETRCMNQWVKTGRTAKMAMLEHIKSAINTAPKGCTA